MVVGRQLKLGILRVGAVLGAAWLSAQAASPHDPDGAVKHLRYERVLQMPANALGETCAVLDADVFAHMASRAGDDLRVFREAEGEPQETAFLLTESGADPAEPQRAIVQAVSVHGETLEFDLAMPHQAYTAVELQIAANNFTAEAAVTGSDGMGGRPVPLGTFTLFDLTQEHLARSTELALQESRFPLLHVSMRMHGVVPTTAMITGATVPPSREAQTLHTIIAATTDLRLKDNGWRTVATLYVPEHVPVEGVRITLDPAWKGEFLRSVSVLGEARGGAREVVDGDVWRVMRPASADGATAIQASQLAIDSVMGINLRSPAKITVSVKNGTDRPLPVRSVALEMRQRMVCFEAMPAARYTLRYGDGGLHAAVYNYVRPVSSPAVPRIAVLGAEVVNPEYVARPMSRRLAEGRSQMFWIGLLATVTVGGSLALHRVRGRV